jgi:hypothetical protein
MKNTSPCAKKQDTMYRCEVANEKAQEALMRSPFFFFCWGRVGRGWIGKGIFVFFIVLNVFSSCSHGVSKKVPQDVPNFTSDLSLMVCPKFNNHVNKLKRWAMGESIIVSILQLKRCFYLGVPNVPNFFDDGPIHMAP